MIYNYLKRPERKATNPGTRYRNLYQETTDKKGRLCLEKIGEEDLYAIIQEDADSADIHKILQAVARGDLAALQQREAVYMDATTMPNNLMDAQNFVIKAKNEFYDLPMEIRKEFDNSPEEFVANIGTKKYLDVMSKYNEETAKIAEEKSHKEYLKKVKDGAQLNYDIAREQAALAAKEGKANE